MKKDTKKKKLAIVEKKTNKISKDVKDFINNKKVFNIRIKKIILILACILCLFLFFKVVGGLIKLIFSDKYPEYPLIYQKANGEMKVIGTKDKSGTKLSSTDFVENVVYANTTDRYALFLKNGSLYLYDAKKKDEKIKVLSDVKSYKFSEDDKYIYALNKSNQLYIYNYKKATKIDSDVSSVRGISKNYIFYVKNGSLYMKKISSKKSDKVKIEDKFGSELTIAKNEKVILYKNGANELKRYNIKKQKGEKIASYVNKYYSNDNCTKFYYVNDEDTATLYYFNGKEGLKIVKDVYDISAIDVDNKIAIYIKANNNKFSLYFQREDKNAVKMEDDLKEPVYAKIYKGKEVYYINSDKELRYGVIRGKKVSKIRTLSDNVSDSLKSYKKGFAFVANMKGNSGELYVVKHGRIKQIDEDVYKASTIKVNTKGNKIYYFKDYGTSSGDLYYTKGSKPKLIATDVYKYQNVKNDLLYYIKDFDVSEISGDLYRYNGKSKLIEKDVRTMAAIPNYFEQ